MSNMESSYRGAYPMLGGKGRYQSTILSILGYVKASPGLTRLAFTDYARRFGVRDKPPSRSSVETSMETLFRVQFLQDNGGIVSIGLKGDDYLRLQGAQRNRLLIGQLILMYSMYREVLSAFTDGSSLAAESINAQYLGSRKWDTPRQVEIRIDRLRECGCLRGSGTSEHIFTEFGRAIAKDFPPVD